MPAADEAGSRGCDHSRNAAAVRYYYGTKLVTFRLLGACVRFVGVPDARTGTRPRRGGRRRTAGRGSPGGRAALVNQKSEYACAAEGEVAELDRGLGAFPLRRNVGRAGGTQARAHPAYGPPMAESCARWMIAAASAGRR
jgi:hypothetical protein